MDLSATRREFLTDSLHLFVLWGFAVAQPLYDVLGQNAEFFVAHRARPPDLILLVFLLSFAFPFVLVMSEALAGFAGRTPRRILHILWIASLTAVAALPPLKKLGSLPGPALLIGAVVLGGLFVLSCLRWPTVRFFLNVLAFSIVLFPALFLFVSPVSKLLRPVQSSAASVLPLQQKPPIVMVIFDEFPLVSLLDEHRQIDPVRYPNFARLTREATWFRNATTVTDPTGHSIASILSGFYPDPDLSLLPTASQVPRSLFTLQGSNYEIRAFESVTRICPESLCGGVGFDRPFFFRMTSTLLDAGAIYLHVISPLEWTSRLPVVTQTWSDFWAKEDLEQPPGENEEKKHVAELLRRGDQAGLFRHFIASIEGQEPRLYFVHVTLPHVPWLYLPSGKMYSLRKLGLPGLNLKEELWGENFWLTVQGHQRHLLQVGFVDKLVGELLERLEELNIYDRALIVITADHGASFQPNSKRRTASMATYQEIAPIPLFIKVPRQKEGMVTDRNVETIDILPTIADVLGIQIPWKVDGQSALDPASPERQRKTFIGRGFPQSRFDFDPAMPALDDALEQKLALFGSGSNDKLFRVGTHRELIGLRVPELSVRVEPVFQAELDEPTFYERVRPDSGFIPGHITGRLVGGGGRPYVLDLAIAVNGTIQAVTQSYQDVGENRFSAIVPETAFQAGSNAVEVFAVSSATPAASQLARIPRRDVTTFWLAEADSPTPSRITRSQGRPIEVVSGAVRGSVRTKPVGATVVFEGWAADIENGEPAREIMIFADGRSIYHGPVELPRPDVAKAYGKPQLERSGYVFTLPLFLLDEDSLVRVFALGSRGVASELSYAQPYLWRWKPKEEREISRPRLVGQNVDALESQRHLGEVGTLDAVSPEVVRRGDSGGRHAIEVSGWAALVRESRIPAQVAIALNGEIVDVVAPCCERRDVADAYKNDKLLMSGWVARVPWAKLRPGENVVTAFVVLDEQKGKLAPLHVSRNIIRVFP